MIPMRLFPIMTPPISAVNVQSPYLEADTRGLHFRVTTDWIVSLSDAMDVSFKGSRNVPK